MPELPHPVIAVDGTAASGKSTFSRELAKRLGYVYVSTGAMYRGVTWYLQEKNVPLNDADSVVREVHAVEIETRLENGHLLFRIGGIDPLSHARESRVNEGVSLVAQIAELRPLLVAGQQSLAAQSPLVMEGRDIGTVVFPRTPYKFYIDANPAIRALRRKAQGEIDVIQKRDTIDQQRTTSPLTRAANAVFLDSGQATVDELVAIALKHLKAAGLKGTF